MSKQSKSKCCTGGLTFVKKQILGIMPKDDGVTPPSESNILLRPDGGNRLRPDGTNRLRP